MKKFKKLEEFINILVEHERNTPRNIFPPAIDGQFAFDCVIEALLGPDYYFVLPCGRAQGNTIELYDILRKYSKEYRKLVKNKQKEIRKHGR